MARGGFASKRGMSPLIATVLLMAFAVALGGMIMNWSIDVSINNECSEINVKVTTFCTQDNSIVLRMQNQQASVPLQAVQLNILNQDIEHVVNVKNSELPTGDQLALSIPFGVQERARVEVIGVVGSKADPFVCEDTPIQAVDPIQEC